MKINELLFLLQWVTLSAAIALLLFKYVHLAMAPQSKTLLAKSKWLGWCQYQELKQISNPRLWEMAQQNNRITTAMWTCTLICVGLFIVNATV